MSYIVSNEREGMAFMTDIEMTTMYKGLVNSGWDSHITQKYVSYVNKKKWLTKKGKSAFTGRDSQMNKVYTAEFCHIDEVGTGTEYDTIPQCQQFADEVFHAGVGLKKRINVFLLPSSKKYKNVAGIAVANSPVIKLKPGHGFTQFVILHELAHQMGFMHHDVGFRKAHVMLTERFRGKKESKNLLKWYKHFKLPMTVSDKIETPEKWLERYFRLEKARVARG